MNKRPCARTQIRGNEIIPGQSSRQNRQLWGRVENLRLFMPKSKLNQSGHKLLKTITSTRRFWLHYGIVRFYKFKTSDSLQLRLNEGIVLWNPQSIHAVLTTH